MGVNFYLKSTATCEKIHIAKISGGWKPLYQAHESAELSKPSLHSINDIKELIDSGKYEIIDECGSKHSWDEFDSLVIKFEDRCKFNLKSNYRSRILSYINRDGTEWSYEEFC